MAKTEPGAPIRALGASMYSRHQRQPEDFYATDPRAVRMLLELETFDRRVWEPTCSDGAIARVLEDAGYDVLSTDKYPRGYGQPEPFDFLTDTLAEPWPGDIITNPPYSLAEQFVYRAFELAAPGRKVAMFLRLTFLEGRRRAKLFESCPPRRVWVASGRLKCAIDGDFSRIGNAGTVAYCWMVWEKGFRGKPELGWFNKG